MKVKIISLFFLLSMCSANTVENSYIEVSDNDFLNLRTIQNNEKISIDSDLVIVNFWASWCLECIEEHELLISLSEIPELKNKILLVSFQDSEDNAISFLNKYGYGEITYVMDENSKFSINSGVFGVPETHIIKNNKIIKKYIGPLTFKNFQEIIDLYS
jgi:cytochrome c biogenesis protein CcmG/thiol:disulfide interchange protein DsbE|tara:strand:+ start:1567 stop:2043 length:477 start_codon:yes stop_codon:yes gene_type:complete